MENTTTPQGDAVSESIDIETSAYIKIIHSENSRSAADVVSCLEAAKSLDHPNLIAIHDFRLEKTDTETIVYVDMERADENLATVLHDRTLDEKEARELLAGIIPALEFLHGNGFVHSRIHPSNVLACGDRVKLSSDRLRRNNQATRVLTPPGLYDAPETGRGEYGAHSDVWSLGKLILDSLTGSPLESGVGKLNAPFREIVSGCLTRDADRRWTLEQIERALNPRAEVIEPAAIDERRPHYRMLGKLAIGGGVFAAGISAWLIWHGHQTESPPPPPPVATMSVPPAAQPVEPAWSLPPAATSAIASKRWAVVGATYRRRADAEKRAHDLVRRSPALEASVYPDAADAPEYFVIFGQEPTEAQAATLLEKVRRGGGPRDSYLTKLR